MFNGQLRAPEGLKAAYLIQARFDIRTRLGSSRVQSVRVKRPTALHSDHEMRRVTSSTLPRKIGIDWILEEIRPCSPRVSGVGVGLLRTEIGAPCPRKPKRITRRIPIEPAALSGRNIMPLVTTVDSRITKKFPYSGQWARECG
jgi:hypothetical protein